MSNPNHEHEHSAPAGSDRGHESEADRASRVPKRPEDTDESGNALNDTGQDNHHRKRSQRRT